MISERMQRAINAQINAEMWSAYLYLSMSMDAADKGLKGISHDTWASAEEMFAQTVEHERNVTKMIYNLCDIATEEHDYATMNMLTWFVNEQIEEEQTALDILDSLKKIGDKRVGLYMIDKELGARK